MTSAVRPLRLFLALLLLLALPLAGHAGGLLKGKVTHQGKPLGGAVLSLYKIQTGAIRGTPDFRSSPAAEDGTFELAVEPGQYFLLARKTADPSGETLAAGDFFAYYGGNPVVIGEGESIHVGVNCVPVELPPEPFKAGGTGLRGVVLVDGRPLAQARVTLYQDSLTIFRGIGYASAMTNDKGEFSFTLEPGEYYVVARKRAANAGMGPLAEGDFFAFAHQNPVAVQDGRVANLILGASAKLIKVKEGGQDVTLGGTVKAGETTVSGTIRDKAGKPVAGVYASAYRDSMMTMKPDFISPATGPDGLYTINLSEGGEYFIGARNTLGGPAERGDLLGRYAGNQDHVVNIKTGEKIGGIDVVVEPVE